MPRILLTRKQSKIFLKRLSGRVKTINLFLCLGLAQTSLFQTTGTRGLFCATALIHIRFKGNGLQRLRALNFQTIVDKASEQGLAGLEWAGGLPGSVGGAVHGNVGAFGGEIKDVLVSVRARTPNGEVKEMSVAECGMAYRESIFKKQSGWVIISAVLELQGGHSPSELKEKVEELREWRRTNTLLSMEIVAVFLKGFQLQI